MKLKIIFTILLIAWMIIIFLFSNQDATKSQSTSDKVASIIIDTATSITNQKITKQEKGKWIENTRFVIRKLAHLTLYFILGILAYFTFQSYSVSHPLIYGICFCFLYACSDEIHQIFSSGRGPKILDVLIDTSGALLSNLILYCIYKLK